MLQVFFDVVDKGFWANRTGASPLHNLRRLSLKCLSATERLPLNLNGAHGWFPELGPILVPLNIGCRSII